MNILLDTLNYKKVSKVPIWLMRQAGRYLPEYMEIRKNYKDFIKFCLTPDAASEVTLQPLKRFDLDAAIIFADILLVPFGLGVEVNFVEKKGPILSKVFDEISINDLSFETERFDNVCKSVSQTILMTKTQLKKSFSDKALIGFAGAPWTVAAYMIEGSSSKDFEKARRFAYDNEDFNHLIEKLIAATIKYVSIQIESGVDVIKLFDSWAGILSVEQFRKFVIEPTKRIVDEIKLKYPKTPIIGFPKGASILLKEYAEKTGVDCVAFDHTVPVDWVKQNIKTKSSRLVLQGNLDNVLLTCDNIESLKDGINNIINNLWLNDKSGFIFNLGHGCLVNTKIKNVEFLIEELRNF